MRGGRATKEWQAGRASADDGKRRTAVLEVDVSPLRATKGGSLRGGRATKRWRGCRAPADLYGLGRSWASFFAFCLHFFGFLTHTTSSCIFVAILGYLFSNSGGLGRVLGEISKGFFRDFY